MSIFFIHIPKAAGTSFISFLQTEFPPTDRLLNVEQFNLAPEKLKAYDHYNFMSGHTSRRFLNRNNIAQNHSYVSILREPLQRLISNVTFHLSFGGIIRDIGDIPGKDIAKNGIEWLLERLPDANDKARAWVTSIQWGYLSLEPSKTPEIDAPKAINTLSTVGLTEFFQESLLLTAFREEIMVPSVEPSLNRWPRQKEKIRIPDALLEKTLGYDYLMYEAACNRFKNDFDEMTNELCAFGDIRKARLDAMEPLERNQLFSDLINKRNIQARREGRYKHVKPGLSITGKSGITQLSLDETGPLRDAHVLERIHVLRHTDWLLADTRADYWINAGNRTSVEISVSNLLGGSQVMLHAESELQTVSAINRVSIPIPKGDSRISIRAEGETLYDRHRAQGIQIPYDIPNVIASIILS